MDQTLGDLTGAEAEWVKLQLEMAKAFVAAHSPEDSESTLTTASLDRAFKKWMSQETQETESTNDAINAVGIAFGQILSQEIGLRWVIASDEHGSDLSLYSPIGEILIYPANFVAKRWERRETDFLESSLREIAKTVFQLTAAAQPKPWWKF
jgi:hypothetical protein